MTDAPPSRYKVVERGRRLVVVDTRTGQPATRDVHPATAKPPAGPAANAVIEQLTPRTIDDRSGSDQCMFDSTTTACDSPDQANAQKSFTISAGFDF